MHEQEGGKQKKKTAENPVMRKEDRETKLRGRTAQETAEKEKKYRRGRV